MTTFTLISQSEYSGECGNFALYHALNLQHVHTSIHKVRSVTKQGSILSAIHGMDDDVIVRAAQAFHVTVEIVETETWASLLDRLKQLLAQGYSCIISTRDTAHWAVVADFKNNCFTVLDSLYDEVALHFTTQKDFKEWVDPCDNFYFIAVKK